MDWIHGLNVLIVLSNFLTQKTGKTVTSLVTAWCWSMLANMEWVTALVASFAPSEGWRLMPAWTKSLATNVSIVASYGSGPVFAWVVPQACHWCWKWNNLFGNPTHVGLSFNMGFDMVGYTGLAKLCTNYRLYERVKSVRDIWDREAVAEGFWMLHRSKAVKGRRCKMLLFVSQLLCFCHCCISSVY